MQEIKTIWNLKKISRDEAADLADDLRIPLSAAKVYINRNIRTVEDYNDFVKLTMSKLHNPWLLPDIKPVINRLEKALDNNEKIFVWGDYDVDGVTATSVVVTALRKLGANFAYHAPHRIKDGYDIKVKSVEKALEAGADLLMSVDCGIVAFEAAEYAKKHGLDLIITDHHHPTIDGKIPDCIGVVNPNRDDPKYPGEHFAEYATEDFQRYPFDDLAGVGIAFKVMMALGQRRGLNVKELFHDLIEYVALGTVADVAPMLDENRVLVHLGCQALSNTSKPGIQELLKVADVQKGVSTMNIGFQLGPRINAIGRLDDAGVALDLLIETNEGRAKAKALQLDTANRRRQSQQEQVTAEAIALVEKTYDLDNEYIIVVGAKGWHPGLIGLVAGKLAEKFSRPALVCSIDEETGLAKGSCRSVKTFNILQALQSPEVWDCFLKRDDGSVVCGGHAFAAGFTLPAENMDKLRKALNTYAAGQHAVPERIINIDALVSFSDINVKFYDAISKLAPFGAMHENPLYLTENLIVIKSETLSDGKHLKLRLADAYDVKDVHGDLKDVKWINALAWRKGADIDLYPIGTKVSVVYTLNMDTFRNQVNLSMTLEDIKILD